ncbi:dihydrodipicolinate synthase family protein [Mucilaginibacter mali]|uniref:Dihydrodipicolinate synthase family protein n=1 Tax=Mucilaginibacter mali TaxID=2740462 RepID=A0A7D4QNN5_9SPHI|nr:dihydrodipicolinate synthase family protein [Mucilaginibacter mali]QKJ32630.1 dihydrodipicolinate synthase family protein [Mucilaginibacter mali]
MEALTAGQLLGNWATVLLPINDDDSINYEKLSDEIDLLIAAGVNGIYTNGTAGEFYNQTEEEFDRISQMVAEKCNRAGMPFQLGCSHMSPKISLERLKRVLHLKPGAIQVILPDWYAPGMPEVIDYLKLMAATVFPTGLVLYNPGHSKKKLNPEDFAEIREAGISLIGCKLAGGDKEWYQKMKTLNPELSLFTPGHKLATGIGFGANGSYSNVACINPKAAQLWYETMLTDMDKALEMQGRIQEFIFKYIIPYITEKGYSDQAIDKFLAAIGGWCNVGTRLRWPYHWIDEAEIKRMRPICKDLLPEFF